MFTQIYLLRFPSDISDQPFVYRLVKEYDIEFNILKADILLQREGVMIIELKVMGHSGGRSDAPPAALMEGLRYAAIVEADLEAIASEAERCFGVGVAKAPPIVQLLAPEGWWRDELGLSGSYAFGRYASRVEVDRPDDVRVCAAGPRASA